MAEEKMLSHEEALGLYDVAKRFLLDGTGGLSAAERKGLGRLLSEIQYTLESADTTEQPTRPPLRPVP